MDTNKTSTDRTVGSGQASSKLSSTKRRFRARELTILGSVILCVIVFGLLCPEFIGLDPAKAILLNSSVDALMLIGMTIVIICGGFDLSVGATLAAGGLTAAVLMKSGVPVPVAVAAALLMGLAIGLVNGLVITKLKVNPFITTLGTMSIIRGIVLVTTKSNPPTNFPQTFQAIAWGKIVGIPIPIILMVVTIVLADILLRNLKFLRRTYFVGSNEDAAALTGINVNNVKIFAFMLTGLLAALAGVVIAARGNSIDPNEGLGAELRVIAAVVVGGASLSGGRGTILGSFLGLLLMQVIGTGLIFMRVAPESQMIAVGLVLILAAMADQAGPTFGKNLISLLTQTRSKKVERAINVALALALVLVLVFGVGRRTDSVVTGKAASGHKQKYVEISLATGLSYWIDGKQGLKDKAAELGVDQDFTGPTDASPNKQIDAINTAVAQGVSGIILVPASATALTPAINKAVEAGVPIVCVDTDAPGSKRFSFIGTGNYNAGLTGGERMGKVLNGKGKVAILTLPGQDNLNERVRGYRDALKKYPGIEVVAEGDTKSQPSVAQTVCRNLLQAYPDLSAFGCVEAAGGPAAAVAVKEAGKVGKVKIVSMDRDEPTLQSIEEGVIDSTVAQRSYMMSYTALQMLYNLKNDQVKLVKDWKSAKINPLPPSVDTGSFLITKENVSQFHHEN